MKTPELLRVERDFFIVDKPPHLLSHPTRPDGAPTLLGWLQEKFPGEFIALINRLDRETSGTILVARTPEAASRLGKLTMERGIEKEYVALVFGQVPAEHGVIEAPLGRLGVSPENPIWLRQGVIIPSDIDGRKTFPAKTEFWREAFSCQRAYSQLRLQAHTGRMHQLRVHLAHLGHAVIGDKIYGPDPLLYLRFIEHGWTTEHQQKLLLPRHALHAQRLAFNWRGERVEVTSPWPKDMQEFWADVSSIPSS